MALNKCLNHSKYDARIKQYKYIYFISQNKKLIAFITGLQCVY